mmetsp:Transcript_43252/g.50087  ORF Transcript_43252/g.50087 Transcript_43252/m.50087 type:complete len:261 (-) Transcript_43252:122-904(-)
MFEARLEQGQILKKLIDSIKDLVSKVNLDVDSSGISLQAMDSSHVALVALKLKEEGFTRFRVDKPLTLGLDIGNLSKIMKCAGSDDIITMKAEEDPSTLTFLFESSKNDKVSEFTLNLLTLDSEQLGIPDTEYSSICTLSSAEFSRICREMNQIAETINIETSKQYIKFSVAGEIGEGSTTLRANQSEKKEEQTILEVDEPVSLSFALRYLNLFNKAQSLSAQVTLYLSSETPLVVEFKIEKLGNLKYYLAPKINEEEAS